MRYFPLAMSILALAAALFTAIAGSVARSQPAGEFQAVLVDLDAKTRHPYLPRTWPGQYVCDAAIGGINDKLAEINRTKILSLPIDAPKADPTIVISLSRLLAFIATRTGDVPRFSLSCELKGDPA